MTASSTEIHALASVALDHYHSGRLEQALEESRLVIKKADVDMQASLLKAEMHHLEAACLHQLERGQEAELAIRAAVAQDPANATYLNTYGVILRKIGRLEEAIRSYQLVIRLNPGFADVYYNCGNAMSELDQLDEAINNFQRCLENNPKHASAHHNLANCLRDQKRLDEALAHYGLSDELEHHNPDMHCNWGLTWQLKERWDKAINAFEVAIAQKSEHAPSYINLGSALSVQERFEEACNALRRGVALDESCNDAKFNLGLTLLTIGEFEEGWHFYDTRLQLPDKVKTPLPDPMWDGDIDKLGGEKLLVWAEQGYGDNIQFVRYIPILIEAGVQVTLSTRKPLIPLLRECLVPHTPAIIEHIPKELQGFRHHVALMSLPRLCGTSRDTVPMMPGYLREPSQVPKQLCVQRQPFAIHIGLVWASGADNKDMYEDKSMALEPLMQLFEDWRQQRLVVVHSLQIGSDADQLCPWLGERGVVDHAADLNDFLDTACVISQLDLVLTVDTAVAHLSGALDKPVWLMLQHNADFRWMRGRSDSPWYRSMTLIRQRRLGDWSSVLEQVRERLVRLLSEQKETAKIKI